MGCAEYSSEEHPEKKVKFYISTQSQSDWEHYLLLKCDGTLLLGNMVSYPRTR